MYSFAPLKSQQFRNVSSKTSDISVIFYVRTSPGFLIFGPGGGLQLVEEAFGVADGGPNYFVAHLFIRPTGGARAGG